MSEKLNILVVEDEPNLRDALCLAIECAGHRVIGAADGPQALRMIERNTGEHALNLVITDLKMQPMDGLTLLREIRAREAALPVLLMTAFGDVEKAVAAMRAGACDFLLKPFEPDVLLAHIDRYAAPVVTPADMVCEDARTRQVLGLAARVARSEATVLLTGESGTGKEVFARYIHQQSARAAMPFIAINCAAIPDNLLEATLFGYEKGAFTGAAAAQAGKFEQANGGTLLLDEISEMPLALQAKMLRVLQEREVERVGGKRPIPLDIRVLATSNRDMEAEARAGRFREDLYYRLNVFPIGIPSLRDRPGDIVPLARHFLAGCAKAQGRVLRLGNPAAAILAGHDWPGNVRELENTVQRAAIMAPDDLIEAEHIILGGQRGLSRPVAVPAAAVEPVMPTPAANDAPPSATPDAPLKVRSVRDMERDLILETLAEVGGSRKKAIEKLGISERTLRYKLARYKADGLLREG
ncbi:sigma-54 dependent transcriptional regulator [Methyloversatilis sp.]|uniref:sigma-54-dependent transcriptional regulator n=1 Tax=Methyloversatilis sp. TaxID=2569862 RepID=UPI002733A026|nr:sigma-54 dependent transcriptional regulator [Methyloversatilis sp.]MDP2867852.1 sigma-54 dependent transcriptional regulator [Methyloversatilis sp.]MDP3288602.1 sigma-54 dependent transcriptional regulator [Methyloversatilis sp.]MDP3455464.1 sigma-54 dependent transcriptional regulator [Methyloversatilis sp.]MDP3577647.1 sigma-54 dependent transcriptional regulator [Methyloversatilis sp.]